jgi:hypothetical protein
MNMKKYLLYTVSALALLCVLPSCHKESVQSENIQEVSIDTTIAAGSDYYLSLAPLGDDDNIVDIIKQGTKYSTSRIENLTDVFNPIYHYAADTNATGPDQVVLAITKNPTCRDYNKDSTFVCINFVIR